MTCSWNTQNLEWDVEDTASPGLSTRPRDFSAKALTGRGKPDFFDTPSLKDVALWKRGTHFEFQTVMISEQVSVSLSHEMLRLSLSGYDWSLWSHWVVSEQRESFFLPDFRRLKQRLRSDLLRKLDLLWCKECCFCLFVFKSSDQSHPRTRLSHF